MKYEVKYQLERAQDALKTALKLGADKEDPRLLNDITVQLVSLSDLFEEYKEETSITFNDINTSNAPVSLYDNMYYVSTSPNLNNINISTTASNDVISFS